VVVTEPPAWSPGTLNLIQGEADRVRSLTQTLDDLASDLRHADVEGWEGDASDAYVTVRNAAAARCRVAAVACEVAARALGYYFTVLGELASRRPYAWSPDELARLEEQRAEAGSLAAARVHEAAEELEGIRGTVFQGGSAKPALKRSGRQSDQRTTKADQEQSRPARAPDADYSALAAGRRHSDPVVFYAKLDEVNEAARRYLAEHGDDLPGTES
jgi:hypothetical protein